MTKPIWRYRVDLIGEDGSAHSRIVALTDAERLAQTGPTAPIVNSRAFERALAAMPAGFVATGYVVHTIHPAVTP